MARSISVKINTVDVISMIENKIAEYEKQIADYPQAKAQYEIDRLNWSKQVASRAIELIASGNHFDHEDFGQRITVEKNYRNINIQIGNELIGELASEMPERPTDPHSGYGSTESKIKELNKTLALLRLTPQETVTSSTYNSVLELL